MKELKSASDLLRHYAWFVVFFATIVLMLFPVSYWASRACLTVSTVILWLWGVVLLRRRRKMALPFFIAGVIAFGWLFMPGRPGDPAVLRQSYVQCLKQYEGTRYVWGGENRFGIDCSGLVRRGFINANIRTGIQTLNPLLVRKAFSLWWHDCSAKALRDEYRSCTARFNQAQSINDIPPESVLPGDLAITSDGSHVLAYLSGKTWIEADPNEMKVITVEIPSDNMWFNTPVHLVRWSQLLEPSGQTRSDNL